MLFQTLMYITKELMNKTFNSKLNDYYNELIPYTVLPFQDAYQCHDHAH